MGKGVTVGRSLHRKLGPDMQGRSTQANLPEGDSLLPDIWDCGSESHRGARCGKTARRDLCGGRRVTGVPTATVRAMGHGQTQPGGPPPGRSRRDACEGASVRAGSLPDQAPRLGGPSARLEGGAEVAGRVPGDPPRTGLHHLTGRWRRRATAYALWPACVCTVWPAPQLGR